MQTLDITLPVGGLQQFDIGGSYFELIEGAGAVDVNFTNSDGSRAGDLEMLGALPGYWVSGPFSRFELKNRHTSAQTLRVMYGRGVGGSRRIQGSVAVIDRSADKTLLQRQFFASNRAGSSAGVQSVVALKASGSVFALRRMFLVSPVAGDVMLGQFTAPGTATAGGFALFNKSIGGPLSTVIASTGNAVPSASLAAGEAAGFEAIARIGLLAGITQELDFPTPFVISGTQGLAVLGIDALRQLSVAFEGEQL